MKKRIHVNYLFALFFLLITFPVMALPATETAIFAGGCFWSMQHDFDKIPGVLQTTVGYTGGKVVNPSYQEVSSGTTGHYEAIKIIYDPAKISYQQLVNAYWHDIDPTDADGQFCDKGNEYHSVIFYDSQTQKDLALASKQQLLQSKFKRIETKILPVQTFYPAEEYHQKYSDKNPEAYAAYRAGCQRDETLSVVWGQR